MSIDIQAILRDGYERTMTRTGLLFAGLFYVVAVVNALVSPEVAPERVGDGLGVPSSELAPTGAQPYAPSLGLSPTVASVLSLLVGIVSVVVTIAAIRTFVGGETERIPREYFRRNILWRVVNVVVGSLAFGLAVAIGLVLLVVPGLFLLVALFFWVVYVVVEDENFVEGFQHSWELTSGHRLQLFVLGVAVVLVAVVVSIVVGIPGLLLPDIAGFLLAQAGSALVNVFVFATLAETYTRLVSMDGDGEELTAGPDSWE